MVAAAMIGAAAASVGSAVIGANGAQSAADTQAGAANNATATQKAMFDATTANVKPWLDAGTSSLGSLMTGVNNGSLTPTSYAPNTLLGPYAPAQTQLGVGGAPQMGMYGPEDKMSKVGTDAKLQAYQQYTAQNPYQSRGDFTVDKFHQDPGYQFQLEQGLNTLTNKSSLAGGMNSNNLKGLIGYAEGMANTDYQQAFGNYQTEANRSLGEYQTGLQDYIQQFLTGQNVNTLNNNVAQQGFQNTIAGTGFNNAATQTDNQNVIQINGLNNDVLEKQFRDKMAAQAFNNQASEQNFQNNNTYTGDLNSVIQQNDQNYVQRQGLNNQVKQQQFSNLASLSQMGLGAGLQQGQISAGVGQSIGQNIIGAGSAQAAGQVGVANAFTGGIKNGYDAWLQQQYMGQISPYDVQQSHIDEMSYLKNQAMTGG